MSPPLGSIAAAVVLDVRDLIWEAVFVSPVVAGDLSAEERVAAQATKQRAGEADRGSRGAVTGGKQMDGFCRLVKWIVSENGMPDASVHVTTKLELPGFFRPTKTWDLLVVHRNHLVAAVELKSQAGPSFGNNFNNRTEEALGTALDLWIHGRSWGEPAAFSSVRGAPRLFVRKAL